MRLFLCSIGMALIAQYADPAWPFVAMMIFGAMLATAQDLDTFTRAKAERRGSIGGEAKR